MMRHLIISGANHRIKHNRIGPKLIEIPANDWNISETRKQQLVAIMIDRDIINWWDAWQKTANPTGLCNAFRKRAREAWKTALTKLLNNLEDASNLFPDKSGHDATTASKSLSTTTTSDDLLLIPPPQQHDQCVACSTSEDDTGSQSHDDDDNGERECECCGTLGVEVHQCCAIDCNNYICFRCWDLQQKDKRDNYYCRSCVTQVYDWQQGMI